MLIKGSLNQSNLSDLIKLDHDAHDIIKFHTVILFQLCFKIQQGCFIALSNLGKGFN